MKPLDLQLNVASIPDAGLVLAGELPSAWVKTSLLDPYTAKSDLVVEIEVRPVGDNVLVQGHAEITLAFDCSHSGQRTERRLDFEFAELFCPETKHEFNLGAGLDVDDIDGMEDEPYPIVNGAVDIEQFLREELVLAQDPYPVADPSARREDDDDHPPIWTSDKVDVDPRWAKLAKLKLD